MDWHKRFLQQASWTRPLRAYLFERAGLARARRVLEIGCGTGAILEDLSTSAAVHGIDLDFARLVELRTHVPSAFVTCGNALSLPYPAGTFDITFCHYLLLWVHDPLAAMLEMKRLTRPGGAVLALAEPDYASRVDRPGSLAPLGRLQTESLRRQGADTSLGSRLAGLFQQAEIHILETGPLRSEGNPRLSPDQQRLEWEVLQSDLQGVLSVRELSRWEQLDRQARERGERVLDVPTYFAWGSV